MVLQYKRVEGKRKVKECHTSRWTCYRGMRVWSDVMIHKFSLSVSGPSDFSSTAGFCLRSSFHSYDTSAFNFNWLLWLHHCSSVLIITLSCFIFMFFEIFQRGSADWLVLLFIFDLWFMVVQTHLCTNNPYKITKTTQTAGVWWTFFCIYIALTFWRGDDITPGLLIISVCMCGTGNVKWIRACSLLVLSLFFKR